MTFPITIGPMCEEMPRRRNAEGAVTALEELRTAYVAPDKTPPPGGLRSELCCGKLWNAARLRINGQEEDQWQAQRRS